MRDRQKGISKVGNASFRLSREFRPAVSADQFADFLRFRQTSSKISSLYECGAVFGLFIVWPPCMALRVLYARRDAWLMAIGGLRFMIARCERSCEMCRKSYDQTGKMSYTPSR